MQSQRHALITGAGTGIGAAVAQALAQAGCKLTLSGRSLDKLESAASALRSSVPGLQVQLAPMDVADAGAVQSAVQQAVTAFGPVHVLVNNAGQARSQPFARTDAQLWQQMLSVNLTGVYHCTQAVLPGMLEAAAAGTPGRIVNIASTAGLQGYAYVSAYVAAKHGLVGMTKSVALETATTGVTVNAVCPGWVLTPLVQKQVDARAAAEGLSQEDAKKALLAEKQPSLQFTTPEQLGELTVFLCSEAASNLRGAAINVDGGWVAQ